MPTPTILITPNAYKSTDLMAALPQGVDTADLTCSRNDTDATRVNSLGNIEVTGGLNEPRIDYSDGGCPVLLVEPTSQNLYSNSEGLVLNDVTTTASSYTLSFYGTGSITLGGAHTHTLNGTGANDRVTYTFTSTSANLTSSISGTIDSPQLEKLPYATSYIPTSGTTQTRAAESYSSGNVSSLLNDSEGVLFVEMAALSNDLTRRRITLSDGTTNNRINLYFENISNRIKCFIKGGGTSTDLHVDVTDITDFHKIAIKYKSGDTSFFVDGSKVDTSSGTFNLTGLNRLDLSQSNGTEVLYGKIKQIQYYDTALTDAQLEDLTDITL